MTRYSDRPVKTFSIGFEERSYSELGHASRVSERFGTDHHELVVRPDVRHLFEDVVTHFDEPFGDSSAVPTFLVSQLAREHVTVALSGTGGDELFAGYERYWAIPLGKAYGSVPRPARRLMSGLLNLAPSGHSKKSFVHRARRFVASADEDLLTQHRGVISLFPSEERRNLYTHDWQWVLESSAEDPLESRFRSSDAVSDLDRLLDVDTGTLLADDYLVKDDRMSMAHSLELRVPLLDHTLVEFAASLPPHLKLRGLKTKYLLRSVAGDLIPKAILKRPKQGFELPIASWLGHDLREQVHELLLSPRASRRGLFQKMHLEHLVSDHTSGHANRSREIWALMALETWFREHVDTDNPAAGGRGSVP
jgi:asparagine synthase (glutamine-hydrolysing)